MPKRLWLAALRVSLLATLAGMAGSGEAADAILDARTLIPGIVDAPVYRADGTNRVSGTMGCIAQFWAGASSNTLAPLIPTFQFGEGELAGYIWTENAIPLSVPVVQAGERVWIQMRAWDPHQWSMPEEHAPNRFQGESALFSLIVSNTPTPLLGLRSFAFEVPPLRISHQGGEVVLRWSAGDGTVYYNVETTPALEIPFSWAPSPGRVLEIRSGGGGWEADWVMTNTVIEPTRLYRVILLNP